MNVAVARGRGSDVVPAQGPGQAGHTDAVGENGAPDSGPDEGVVVPPHLFDGTPDLARALRLDLAEAVRTLGAGWQALGTQEQDDDEVAWFVAGEPAQVMVGVGREYVRVSCPREAVGRRPWVRTGPPEPDALVGMRTWWDHRLVGWLVGAVAEAQRRRRRSFVYCHYCRKLTAPEASRGIACSACAARYARLATS